MICPLGLTFFGLTPETAPQYRERVFMTLHEIVFHGNGGYDWDTVYNMPIWLRKFTFLKIKEFYEEQNQTMKGNPEKSWVDPKMKNKAKQETQKITPPSFLKSKPSRTSYK